MSYLKNNNRNMNNQNFNAGLGNNMPHLYLENGKFTTNTNYKPNLKQNSINNKGFPISKEQLWFNRFRDWGFYIVVGFIVVYSLYRLLKGGIF